jgi:dipeptidyl aminopeptidase/acylaminoacyl peptidase
LATNAARRGTPGQATDSAPRWSPDGKTIVFVSTRAGKAQVYTIAVDGGEATALTRLPQGVAGSPEWSPDGKLIAFCAPPQVEPRNPAMSYHLTRHVYRFDGLGYVDDVAQSIYVVPSGGGEARRLTTDACHNTRPLWSPDGATLLYSAAMHADRHSYDPDLMIVDLTGATRPVLADWGAIASYAWLPDGRVVFAGIPKTFDNGTQNRLWTIGADGGGLECRSEGMGLHVAGRFQGDAPSLYRGMIPRIAVSPDGRFAYVQVQAGGTIPIYEIALHGGESWRVVTPGERWCFLLDLRGSDLLFAVSALNNPTDLCLARCDGSGERQLTHLNKDVLAELALPSAERLLFPGSDGVAVEGWLLKPPVGDAPYPTVLYIHGGPHSAFGHVFHGDWQMLAGAGYAVLLVNHRASTGYGDAFGTAIKGDWGNLDYHDLMAGVDLAVARGLADADHLGVCGLSGGGNLSCWIVGQTNRFKAAVPENPVTNWVSFYGVSDIGPIFAVDELGGKPHEMPDVYARCSPITYAHRCTTPTLLIQGEADYRCPAEQSEQFYTVLKANGCVAEMVRLPASPHGGGISGAPALRRGQNEALLGWMNRFVRQPS